LPTSTNRNQHQQQGKKKPLSIGQHIQQQMAPTTTNSTETQQVKESLNQLLEYLTVLKKDLITFRGEKHFVFDFSSLQNTSKKADWRKKHESFIEAIRAAKKVSNFILPKNHSTD